MDSPRPTSVLLLRALVLGAALALVVLWVDLAVGGPVPPGVPPGAAGDAGGAALPPVLLGVAIFSSLALVGAVAAFRDAPVVVALTGLISLVPVGLYTLVLPWPHRSIGVLDAVLVLAGILLLRVGVGDTTRSSGAPPGAP